MIGFIQWNSVTVLFHVLFTLSILLSEQGQGPSWSWSYGCWIYDYLCNQYPSPLMLWVRIPLRRGVLDTTLCDKVCQWVATGWWFSLGTMYSPSLWFPPPKNWPPRYNWNIVENGIKQHNPNPYLNNQHLIIELVL